MTQARHAEARGQADHRSHQAPVVAGQPESLNPISQNSLTGKVALVTGGSRSIGAAIVKRLAAVGFTYCASPDKANEVVSAIESSGGRALAIQAGSATEATVRGAVQRTAATFGGLDILVNNAGVGGFAA